MGFVEKVGVLDLIINVLREHERDLDGLIQRLEAAVERVERVLTFRGDKVNGSLG